MEKTDELKANRPKLCLKHTAQRDSLAQFKQTLESVAQSSTELLHSGKQAGDRRLWPATKQGKSVLQEIF